MKLYRDLSSALKIKDEVQALKLTLDQFHPALFEFSHLKELYLEGNVSELPLAQPVPWKELKILSLKLPQFKGELSPLFYLPALENLKIIETPLSHLRLPLGHVLAPVKFLTIKSCGLKSLPEEMGMLSHLLEMNVSGNELRDLPTGMIDLQLLRRLNMDQNKFTQFPAIISRMKSLKQLSIDDNLFSDEEKARIQREFHITPH